MTASCTALLQVLPGGRLELLIGLRSLGFGCACLCFVAMGTVGRVGVEAEPGSFGVGVAPAVSISVTSGGAFLPEEQDSRVGSWFLERRNLWPAALSSVLDQLLTQQEGRRQW